MIISQSFLYLNLTLNNLFIKIGIKYTDMLRGGYVNIKYASW